MPLLEELAESSRGAGAGGPAETRSEGVAAARVLLGAHCPLGADHSGTPCSRVK